MEFLPAPDCNVVIPEGLAEKFRGPADPCYEWMINDLGQRLSVLRYEAENAKADLIVLTGACEAKEKYSELHHDLFKRGYSVHAMDWAFQGLSEGAPDHRRRHTNGVQSDVNDLSGFIDDVDARRPDRNVPLVIMASSYGGHVVSRYAARRDQKADGLFLSAPMTDFRLLPGSSMTALSGWGRVISSVFALAARVRGDDSYAPLQTDWSLAKRETSPDADIFSNDDARRLLNNQWYQANKDMQIGGYTLKWVIDAVQSCRELAQTDFCHLQIPVVAALAEHEVVTVNEATKVLMSRIPTGELIEIPDSLHEMWMCKNAVRNRMLDKIDDMVLKL